MIFKKWVESFKFILLLSRNRASLRKLKKNDEELRASFEKKIEKLSEWKNS